MTQKLKKKKKEQIKLEHLFLNLPPDLSLSIRAPYVKWEQKRLVTKSLCGQDVW